MLRALKGTVIVEPLFDRGGRVPPGTNFAATDAKIEGFEYKGIVLAATGENPQSQQGIVLASAIDEFVVGMHAIYMPYHGEIIRLKGKEHLVVPDRELVAWIEDEQIVPRNGWLLIQPKWPSDRVGSILLPEFSGLHDPVLLGSVLRQGAMTVTEGGTRVVMAPDAGFEVGMMQYGENVYLVNEQHLLATIESNGKNPGS